MKFLVWSAVIFSLALGGAGIFFVTSKDAPKEPVLIQKEPVVAEVPEDVKTSESYEDTSTVTHILTQTSSPEPEKPKQIPAGALVYADFWKTASKGTTLEKYVWGASGDDDYYDGGEGIDTLQYFGTRAEHEIVRSPLSPADANSFLLIRRIRDNSMDIVLNIEIFVFADQTVKAEDLFK